MNTDSLKRVLMTIKEEARKMRAGRLGERLKPKDELDNTKGLTEAAPEESGEEPVVALEVEGEESPEMKDDELAQIKKLLARV